MTIVEYLTHLTNLRDLLAYNLNRQGVAASNTESLTTLIPKVLSINTGNPYTGYFLARFTGKEFDNQYGVIIYNTPVSFKGLMLIEGYYKMSSFTLKLAGSGITALSITAPGASVVKSSNTAGTITFTTPDSVSRHNLQDMLDGITFKSNSNATVTITASAVERDTGTVYNVTGSVSMRIQKNCWGIVQTLYPTFTIAEKMTWTQMENMVRPT